MNFSMLALKKVFPLIGLLVFFFQEPGFAQQNPLNLNLKSEISGAPSLLGEFRISLDSQILIPKNGTQVSEFGSSFSTTPLSYGFREARAAAENPFLAELSRSNFVLRLAESSRFSGEPRIHKVIHQKLSPTLTLSANYLEEQQRYGFSKTHSLGAKKLLGRWAVYGEVGKKFETSLRERAPKEFLPVVPSALANVSAAQTPSSPKTHSISSEKSYPTSEDIPALNNYYLEAIYNFRPSLQGKVSYQRSLIDTLERNENLQVEGIVEAGQDVLIKAGYRNQTTPEKAKNAAPPNDTKVWTEFILKF